MTRWFFSLPLLLLIIIHPIATSSEGSVKEQIENITADPNGMINSSHYVASNESHYGLMLPFLKEVGGVYIGIATDQNFLLIPKLKSEYVIMMDLDQWVVDMHRIYQHLFRTRNDPSTFIQFFHERYQSRSLKELKETFTDADEQKRVIAVFRRYRERLYSRLVSEKNRIKRFNATSFLDTQEHYDYMVDLCKNNRFIFIRGDLTGDQSMTQIASILNQHNLKVGAIALSNAEQYFDFTASYRRNMLGFQYLEDAVIIRTNRKNPQNRYEYYLQDANDFLSWLQLESNTNVQGLLKDKTVLHDPRIYQLGAP